MSEQEVFFYECVSAGETYELHKKCEFRCRTTAETKELALLYYRSYVRNNAIFSNLKSIKNFNQTTRTFKTTVLTLTITTSELSKCLRTGSMRPQVEIINISEELIEICSAEELALEKMDKVMSEQEVFFYDYSEIGNVFTLCEKIEYGCLTISQTKEGALKNFLAYFRKDNSVGSLKHDENFSLLHKTLKVQLLTLSISTNQIEKCLNVGSMHPEVEIINIIEEQITVCTTEEWALGKWS